MTPENSFRARLLIVALLMLTGFGVLIFKLWYEQVLGGEHYRKSISRQSVRRVRLPGLRGRIFTADYCLLADNKPSYNLVFYLQEMRRNSRKKTVENIRNIASILATEFNRPDDLTSEKIIRHITVTPGLPLVLYKDLDSVELARAFQLMPQMPGVGVEVVPVRNYPEGSMASLVIGYTRSENADKAADRSEYFYYRPDQEGKSGVELAFEENAGLLGIPGLQSFPGSELMQVDHLGYVNTRRLEYQAPRNGNNIVLTLDSRAQKLGEELMQNRRGALVLLDADTGEVLALVSSPHMDLGKISPVWSKEYYQQLLEDPGIPMFDRATRGSYMPGSIIKPLVALAALARGVDPESKVKCNGRSIVDGKQISCANRYGHGELNMLQALERSCNDYFIEVGLAIGAEYLADFYGIGGIGEATGLETGGTVGLNPIRWIEDSSYRWSDHETALISIGQGKVQISPLQAARYTAAIANGGKLMKLYLLKEVYDEEGKLLFRNKPQVIRQWDVSPEALTLVQNGMYNVVNAPQGSGRSGRSSELTIYGKTGTAEVDIRNERIKNTWFTSFVTYKGKRYALTVLVEEGRSGGRDCAPVAKEFYERYLSRSL